MAEVGHSAGARPAERHRQREDRGAGSEDPVADLRRSDAGVDTGLLGLRAAEAPRGDPYESPLGRVVLAGGRRVLGRRSERAAGIALASIDTALVEAAAHHRARIELAAVV